MRKITARTVQHLLQAILLLSGLVFAGCGADDSESNNPPLLVAGLSSLSISQGESVELSWSSDYADSITLSPGNTDLAASGAIELTPAQSTTYVLSAQNQHGNATEQLYLEVRRDSLAPLAPAITSVYAFGRSVTLAWSSSRDDLTPQDELVYRIYYSDGEPSLNRNELVFLGEQTGGNEFSADDLPASSRLHFYVLAVDLDAIESNLSDHASITTGSIDPVLRDDLVMIDLDEAAVAYEKTDASVVIQGFDLAHDFAAGDVLISYEADESFVARIQEVNTTDTGLALVIEPMSVFELYSAGSFNAVLTSETGSSNEDNLIDAKLQARQPDAGSVSKMSDAQRATGTVFDYETDVGPLNIKTKLDFKPRVELNYEFGAPLTANARMHGDWSAELAASIVGSGAHTLEREFTVEPLSFETEYRAKVKARKPYTFMFTLKIDVNGYASVVSDGQINVSAGASAYGSIDEMFAFDGSLTHESRSSRPVVKISPEASAIGNASALISIRPVARIVTVQGALDTTVSVNQDYSVNFGVESVPGLDTLRELDPRTAPIQLTHFDLGWVSKCSVDARMFGLITVANESGCDEQYELFRLPSITIDQHTGSDCILTLTANESGGINSQLAESEAYWMSKTGLAPVIRGPVRALSWSNRFFDYAQTIAFFSASTDPLGGVSLRHVSRQITPAPTDTTYVMSINSEGLDVQFRDHEPGKTVEEACQSFDEANHDLMSDWRYAGVREGLCVFTLFGRPIDLPGGDAMEFRVSRRNVCRQ